MRRLTIPLHIPFPLDQIMICSKTNELPAYDICQCVMVLASLLPGCVTRSYQGDAAMRAQLAEMCGPMPAFFGMEGVFPYCTLQQLDELRIRRGAVFGVTNQMLAGDKGLADVVVDLAGYAGKVHLQ